MRNKCSLFKYSYFNMLAIVLFALYRCDANASAQDVGKKIDNVLGSTTTYVNHVTNKMVRAVKKGVASAGELVDDSRITTRVKFAMMEELGAQILHINVKTTNGVVVLTGSTDSQENKDRADKIANAVDGVKMVDNRLSFYS